MLLYSRLNKNEIAHTLRKFLVMRGPQPRLVLQKQRPQPCQL